MKVIAYILLVSMVLMGTNRFMHGMDSLTNEVEMSCDMDCCASHDDCDSEEHPETDHNCPPGCDCGCCFHITAIYYQFTDVPAADIQSYHFAGYLNNYQFEYFIPLFQPPRLA